MPGGTGTFQCVQTGAGKGILQPYKDNPHWFAYNGTDPVWLKSYYETGHGVIAQDEIGWQYLIFAGHGEPFAIKPAKGSYQSNVCVDTKTSTKRPVNSVLIQTDNAAPVLFTPPSQDTDWVLILRANEVIGK